MKEIILNLTNVVTLSAGRHFRGKIPEKPGSGIYAIQMKDVSPEDGVCWESVIETELISKKQPDWLAPGDILFVYVGQQGIDQKRAAGFPVSFRSTGDAAAIERLVQLVHFDNLVFDVGCPGNAVVLGNGLGRAD